MESILKKIIATKHREIEADKRRQPQIQLQDKLDSAPATRNFLDAIRHNNDVALIAEVKKASPSKGLIRDDFHPVDIATAYAEAGATCVSVLTDQDYFQGHLDYLTDVRQSIDIPVLRKDFIIDPYQVYQARVAGADAVLLIAECLDELLLNSLHDLIVSLNMTPLVELHDEANLPMVLNSGAQLVGVNNRNLETFETRLEHCLQMRDKIPDSVSMVGESGIFTAADVSRLRAANIDAMLVGESLMRCDDIGQAVRTLLST